MDTKSLIADAKARFNHNSAKAYLEEKYQSKLVLADQGGLWNADGPTISFLDAMEGVDELVLVDTFGNPVQVDRALLLKNLREVYIKATVEWYKEWKELETKR